MANSTICALDANAGLADEIRHSESFFVDAAVKAFEERIKMEYYRLRGYAIEAGDGPIVLDVQAVFNFKPGAGTVEIVTVPVFTPQRLHSKIKVNVPKPDHAAA